MPNHPHPFIVIPPMEGFDDNEPRSVLGGGARGPGSGLSFSRRSFLSLTSVAAAGVAASTMAGTPLVQVAKAASVDTSKILNYNPRMGYRRLGKTGLLISEISLGAHWANREGGRMWATFANEEVPEDVIKNRTEVVSRCIDQGINFVDITNAAECLAYGAALKGRREKMIVAADDSELSFHRAEYCNAKSQLESINTSLRRLKMDYIDIWRAQFRHDGNHPDEHIDECIEAFEQAHSQGKVRFLGMSTHTRAFVQHCIDKYPQFSVVMFPYMAKSKVRVKEVRDINPAEVVQRGSQLGDQGTDTKEHDKGSIFESVRNQDVGVVGIKPFGGGSLFRGHPKFGEEAPGGEEDSLNARLTLAFILCNPAITAAIPGMTTAKEVDNNVRASSERLAMLNQNQIWRLCEVTDHMWNNLPMEYQWLHDWEWV